MNRNILFSLLAASSVMAAEFNIGGEVKLHGNAYKEQQDPRFGIDNTEDSDIIHNYTSTFKLKVHTQFNEKWSAEAKLNADGDGTLPRAVYDGAFVQYKLNHLFAYKFGDLTYSEGAFNYYDYDDTGKFAAGLRDRNIRGTEIKFWNMMLGVGFKRGLVAINEDGFEVIEEDSRAYIVHFGADIPFGRHSFRSYINYESEQASEANSLRSGMILKLDFSPLFKMQAVHASYTDVLRKKYPIVSQAITFEPEFNLGMFNLKGTFYYAFLHDNLEKATPTELPEYMFAYLEPGLALSKSITFGIPVEYHTMALDSDADLEQIFVGPRLCLNPTDKLSIKSLMRMAFPIGDNYTNDDMYLGGEVEIAFTF